jgi:hypothetical protein
MADDDDPTGPAAGASDGGREVVAHLQAAALEVIAAVRALLDAAETVVRDPSGAVAVASDLASRARTRRREGDGGEDDGGGDDGDGGVQRIPVS